MMNAHMCLTGHDIRMWLKKACEELESHVDMLDAMDLGSGLDNYTGSSAYATFLHAYEDAGTPSSFMSIGWGLDNFASALHRSAHGVIGVLLAALFTRLSQLMKGDAMTVGARDVIAAITGCRDVARECFLPAVFERDPDTVNSVLASIADEMESVDEDDIYQVVGTIWSAAQLAFVESAEANAMRADARAAVIVLIAGALADAVGQTRNVGAQLLPVTHSMLGDMRVEPLSATKRTRADMPFLCRYAFQGDAKQASQLRSMFIERGIYGAMSGKTDLLGIGLWQVVLRSDRPHTLLPSHIDAAIISNPTPPRLVYPTAPSQQVVRFEPLPANREDATYVPRLVAITRAPGLIEELANSSAVVYYQPRQPSARPAQPTLAEAMPLEHYSSTSLQALLSWLPDSPIFVAPCDQASREMVLDIVSSSNRWKKVDVSQYIDSTDTLPLRTIGGAAAGEAGDVAPAHAMTRPITILPADSEIHMLEIARQWSTLAVQYNTMPGDIRQLVASIPALAPHSCYATAFDAAHAAEWIGRHTDAPDTFAYTVLVGAGEASVDAMRIAAVITDIVGNAPVQVLRGGQQGPTLIGMVRL